MIQKTMVRGVGLPLVFANWFMAGWAIAWVRPSLSASLVKLTEAIDPALPSILALDSPTGNSSRLAGLCQYRPACVPCADG